MQPGFSPDQSVRVEWSIEQGRMSHEIELPCVAWAATGERILDMGRDWDGHLQWHGDGSAFTMHYRRYVAGGRLIVWVDPRQGIFRLGGEQGKDEPLAAIHPRLLEEIERTSH